MQPSFPASDWKKLQWYAKGKAAIKKAAKQADLIVISHYHWDHFLPDDLHIYRKKLILAKNPNEFINDSQRNRAVDFYSALHKKFGKGLVIGPKQTRNWQDPATKLKSTKLNFGSYQARRRQLLKQGARWFKARVKKWQRHKQVKEVKSAEIEIRWAEGKEFRFGKTRLRFTQPLFHGIEYSKVGWVFATVVERGKEKFIHSSDLNGPIIEDYAAWLIKENPRWLVLDGPMTYMLGYMLNLINLQRVIKNMLRIIKQINFEWLIWDHHLPRERLFRKHTKPVWKLAAKLKKRVLLARELAEGKKPVVEEV